MAETQQKYALQYLLDYLSLILDELHKDMDNLSLYLLTGKASDKLERVLPSISALCNWLSAPETLKILLKLQLNADLLVKSNVFVKLAEIATQLIAILDSKTETTDTVEIYLPELVISSSFYHIFVSPPAKGTVQTEITLTHACLPCILVQKHLLNALLVSKDINTTNDRVLKNVENDHSSQEELNDSLIKQLVMDEEESSSQHKWVLEVRPQYLIPDTNTFVDHLLGLKKIVDSKQFTVLVPTTVIAELSSLALDLSSTRSFLSSEMLLGDNAQLNINGNILPKLSFAYETTDCSEKRTNDDRILAACVTLADKQPSIPDRRPALSIKAIAAKIPVRTVPEFLKWASI
uniref:PIN domain-containing protein n=1 Tax=Ditylenchus dipsaci TaxID=166011 RepID=A0A915ET33_9BILA